MSKRLNPDATGARKPWLRWTLTLMSLGAAALLPWNAGADGVEEPAPAAHETHGVLEELRQRFQLDRLAPIDIDGLATDIVPEDESMLAELDALVGGRAPIRRLAPPPTPIAMEDERSDMAAAIVLQLGTDEATCRTPQGAQLEIRPVATASAGMASPCLSPSILWVAEEADPAAVGRRWDGSPDLIVPRVTDGRSAASVVAAAASHLQAIDHFLGGDGLGAAELRALLVHGAVDPAASSPDGPGWGRLDIQRSVALLSANSEAAGSTWLHRGQLLPGESRRWSIAAAGPTLQATLAWQDPWSDGPIVHQLDLQVDSADGTSWLPWQRGDGHVPAYRSLQSDASLERVSVDGADGSVYHVIVRHGGGDGAQSFALLVSGGRQLRPSEDDADGSNRSLPFAVDSLPWDTADDAPSKAGSTGSGDGPAAFFQPVVEAGQVAEFSGAASYAVPIDVPRGAGSLQIPLTLRYNSDLVSSKTGDFNTDGGWLGLGWDLQVGRVELTNRTTGASRLILNGQSSELVYSHNELSQGPGACTDGDASVPAAERWDCTGKRIDRLNVKEARFWRIRKTSRTWEKDVCECVEGCKQEASVPGRIQDDAKYEVWDKGGTKYEFGSQAYEDLPWRGWAGPGPNLSSRAYHLRRTEGQGPDHKEAVFRSWGLEKVVDPHGNAITVRWKGYNTQQGWSHNCHEGGLGLPHYGFKEIYPSRILYTTNPQQGDQHAEWEVEFVTSRKQFDTLEDFGIAQSGVKLESIKVWFHPVDGSPSVLMGEHRFVYAIDTSEDSKSYRLVRIDRYGKHGAGSGSDNQLPSLHFEYALRTIRWNQTSYDRYFLREVDDSIGGGLQFSMQDWNAAGYRKQVVQAKTVDPGIGPLEVATFDYLDAITETEDDGTERLVGFGKVRRHLFDRRIETTFLVYGNDPEHILTGKRHTRLAEAPDGTDLSKSEWKWWPEERTGAGGINAGYFVKKYEERDWMWDEVGNEHSKKTHYLFEPDFQGGEQSGNVTTVYVYDSVDATTPYRSSRHHFGRNAEAWILDRRIETSDHEGYPGSPWLRRSRWVWNDAPTPDHTVVGDRGLLYAERRSLRHSVGERMVDVAFDYDGFGNRTQEKIYYGFGLNDQYPVDGCATNRQFDNAFHTFLIGETNCLGHRKDYFYYGIRQGAGGEGLPGQPQMLRDTNNLYTNARQYDLKGRLRYRWNYGTTIWDTSQASEVYSYNTADRRVKRKTRDDGQGAVHYRTSWTFFDALGRVVQTQENWGNGTRKMQQTHYLANGQVERVTTPRVKAWSGDLFDLAEWLRTDLSQTTTTYDALGRPKIVRRPDQSTLRYGYDGPWGQTSEINPTQTLQRTHVYDSRGHAIRTEEWNMLGGPASERVVTHRTYDVLGQLTGITDDAGNAWTFEYDALGQKVRQSDPGRGAQIFTYNARGQLRHHRNSLMQRTCYWYDAIGRLTDRHTVGASNCPSTPPSIGGASYTYDQGHLGLGHRTAMASDGVEVSWTYDGKGRKTKETVDYPGHVGPFITRWTYDQSDRVATLRYPDNSLAVYGYHGASGLPRSLHVDGQAIVANATYDPLDRAVHTQLGNGYAIDRTFNGASGNHRLYELESSHGGHGASFKMRYLWDPMGNLNRWIDFEGPEGFYEEQLFSYDFLGRVTGARTASSQAPYDLEYGYDSIGNLLSIENHLTGATDTWTYQSAIPHAKTHRNGQQKLTYDGSGRVLQRTSDAQNGSFSYTYDTANQLTSVQGPSGFHQLIRDADGRLAASLWAAQDTFYVNAVYELTRNHLVGGEGIVGGSEGASGEALGGEPPTSIRRYFLFDGRRIAQRTTHANGTTETHYLHPDHLGSVHLVTDASGAVVRRMRTLPYGQERWNSGSPVTEFHFNGERRHDRYGGIYAMGARFYDAEYRTWLTADTILPNVRRPQSLNPYAFVEGNPLRYVDPTGHAIFEDDPTDLFRFVSWAAKTALVLLDETGVLEKHLPQHHAVGALSVGVALYDVVAEIDDYQDAVAEAQNAPTQAQRNLQSDVAFGEGVYGTGVGLAQAGSAGLAWYRGLNHIALYPWAIATADEFGTRLAEDLGVGLAPRESAGLLSGVLGTMFSPYETGDSTCDSLCQTAHLEYDQTGHFGDALIFLAEGLDNGRDLIDLGGSIINNLRQSSSNGSP